MRHPSDYYVRFLLAASWGNPDEPLTLEAVNQSLEDLCLQYMTVKQWDYLLSAFMAPADFLFNNPRHAPTAAFMKQEKIATIWSPDEHMKRVLTEMVGDHCNRSYQHDLHILLMGDLPPDFIAPALSKKYRLSKSLTDRMVELYSHYFWRKENLTKTQWPQFLAGDPNYDSYISALQAGEQQALFRAGLNPKYEYKAAMRDSYRQFAFRVQYLGYQQDDKKTYVALSMLNRELRAMYGVLYGEGGGYEEQLKEVRHWILTHRDVAIPALSDLTGPDGLHSGDGKEGQKVLVEAKQENQVEEKGDPDAGNEDA